MADDRTVGAPEQVTSGERALDETDPHAGDDAEWAAPEPASAANEPSPLRFWQGLVLGILVSTAAWLVLALVALLIYRLTR